MKQILLCFFVFTMILFSSNAMNKTTGEEQKKSVNSPRRQSPLASPRPINLPVSAIAFEFSKEEDGIYHVQLGEQNFKEIGASSKKRRNGQKKTQELEKIIVLDQHELDPLVEYIKQRHGFAETIESKNQYIYSLQKKVISMLKGEQQPDENVSDLEAKIGTQKKMISHLDNTSTIGLHDTRTFAEKNVVNIGIISFCAGVVMVSGIWLWHLK